MDAFDMREPEKPRPARDRSGLVWNILTGIVLLMVLCACSILAMIFVQPQSSLNPYPPDTLPPTFAFPTPTETYRNVLPPTWTTTATSEPTATRTPRPTSTPIPTDTPYVIPTDTPKGGVRVTPTAKPQFSFVLQQGSPQPLPNIYHQDAGCNWMGVAGQAISMNSAPVIGLFIQLGGTLEGQLYETKLSMTGTATEYGRGGYEFVIADHTVTTNHTLWVQLMDQANLPLSDKIYFDTYQDCNKNLILINLVQVK